jgi:hypothetical protein
MAEKKKKWKKSLVKEIFLELIPSLFQLKILFPALLLAGAAGYIGYDFGFDAGADSIICPELDCSECLDQFTCDDLQDFEYCFPCPEVRDITNYTCEELVELRPECYECPQVDCGYCCAVLDCIC